MGNGTAEKAFQLIVEGYTKSEIRAHLGLSAMQWAAVIESPQMRKLFTLPSVSAFGLAAEIEEELFSALRAYNSMDIDITDKEREVLAKRIDKLSHRYSTFLLPITHKRHDSL